MPFARHSSIASSIARRSSASLRSLGVTRPLAVSTKTPVGAPLASRMISPPSGACVSGVMPKSAIAFALTSAAWPSARVRITGLSGETAESAWCVGNPRTAPGVGAVHFSSCQPRP